MEDHVEHQHSQHWHEGRGKANPSGVGSGGSGSTNSSGSAKPARATSIIPAASFTDTIAFLVLFQQLPIPVLIIVHALFILALSTSRSAPGGVFTFQFSAKRLRGVGGSGTGALFRTLITDLICAIIAIYSFPLLTSMICILAEAIIASSLGGGSSTFATAIYSTSMVELSSLLFNQILWAIFPSHYYDRLMYKADHDILQSFSSSDGGVSHLSLLNFVKSVKWGRELPKITFLALSIHIILIELLPYLAKLFPGKLLRHDSSSSSSGTSGSSADSADIDEPNGSFDFIYSHSARKNKRLAIVRQNQPLWTALASSIVLAARQEEQLQHEKDQLQLNEKVPSNLHGVCYVRYIFENIVAFEMQGFDQSVCKFSARVNGIQWPQVSVQQSLDGNESNFFVVVYGLTPATQYDFEVLYSYHDDGNLIPCLKVSVFTATNQKSGTGGSANGSGSNNSNGRARPLSPVTTLLDTLATTQMNLSEEKSSLKKMRKDHARRLQSLRSETESLKTKIDTVDRGEERNRRKVLSLRESVRQYEEEIQDLQERIEKVTLNLRENTGRFEETEREWNEVKGEVERKTVAQRKVQEEYEQELASIESECQSLMQRKEKLVSKQERLRTDIEKTELEIAEIVKLASQEREKNRDQILERRRNIQSEFSHCTTMIEQNIEATKKKTQDLWVAIQMEGS